MAARNIGLSLNGLLSLFTRSAEAGTKSESRLAVTSEARRLFMAGEAGSKAYTRERLRADVDKAQLIAGINKFQ